MTQTRSKRNKRESSEMERPNSCCGAITGGFRPMNGIQHQTNGVGPAVDMRDCKKHREKDVPGYFYCPLTLDVMVNPVLDREGNSFEKSAIVEWVQKDRISPVSRQPLNEGSLVPNIALRNTIHQYMGDEWSRKKEAEAKKKSLKRSWTAPNWEHESNHRSKKVRRIDGFLQDISRSIGKNLRLNSSGISAFSYEDLTIVVEVPEHTDCFYIYTTKILPLVSPEMKDKILELNHMQQRTRGGCLSVTRTDENESEITFSFTDRAFEINSADFRNILENFIDTAIALRAVIFDPSMTGRECNVPVPAKQP